MPKQKPKEKKKKRKISSEQWKEMGESLSSSGKKLADIESSERSKTQSLKDKLYIKRSGRG